MAELDVYRKIPLELEHDNPAIDIQIGEVVREKNKILTKELYEKIMPFLSIFMLFTILLSVVLMTAKIYTVQKEVLTNTQKVNLLNKENEGIKIELLKKSGLGSIEKSVDENIYENIDTAKAIKVDLNFDNFSKPVEIEKEYSIFDKIIKYFQII